MQFTKADMQAQLSQFLKSFSDQLAPMIGIKGIENSPIDDVQTSPIYMTVSEMYDYGVMGQPVLGITTKGSVVSNRHGIVERFLYALDTLPMKRFLDEYDNAPPSLAILSARCATARLVLDGSDRHTDTSVDEFGPGYGEYGFLTLAEMALLAKIDERSVRNAANPKLPNFLKTEAVGRRSLVRPEEARRWLEYRKGFTPTLPVQNIEERRIPEFNLDLDEDVVQRIKLEAEELGVPFEVHLRKKIFSAAEKMMNGKDAQ